MRARVAVRLLTCAALLTMLCPSPCRAWGAKGHTWIVGNAIELLPPGLLKTKLAARRSTVEFNALVPDFQWKDGTIAAIESPNHFIDLELLNPNPKPADLPRSRLEAMSRDTRAGVSLSAGGMLPWQLQDYTTMLANAFRAGRETDILLLAGALGHYAGDATQPLHCTVHFDGRADQKGPDGRKLHEGCHFDYEVTYLEDFGLEFRESSLRLAQPARVLPDVWQSITAQLFDSLGQVAPFYTALDACPSPKPSAGWDRSLGDLTRRQLAKGSTFLASLWLTAWQDSGATVWPEGARR